MYPLTRHLQKTAAKIDECMGWTFGRLIIEPGPKAYIQQEDGREIPVLSGCHLEVCNGSEWVKLNCEDLPRTTTEGWPAYAGLDARMKP